MTYAALAPILYQAMASDLGLVLTVDDFVHASQALYSARRACDDPDLSVLQIRRSPHNPESEIWLVKASVKPEAQVPPAVGDLTSERDIGLPSVEELLSPSQGGKK